jgi:hypothetical protein
MCSVVSFPIPDVANPLRRCLPSGSLNQHGRTTHSFVLPWDWRFLPKLGLPSQCSVKSGNKIGDNGVARGASESTYSTRSAWLASNIAGKCHIVRISRFLQPVLAVPALIDDPLQRLAFVASLPRNVGTFLLPIRQSAFLRRIWVNSESTAGVSPPAMLRTIIGDLWTRTAVGGRSSGRVPLQ